MQIDMWRFAKLLSAVLAVIGGWAFVGPSSALSAVAVQPNGKLVVARDQLIARFNPDGSLDKSFGGNGYVKPPGVFAVSDIAAQPDGRLLVTAERSVFRFTRDGRLDSSFGGGDGIAWAAGDHLTLLPNGKLLVAGEWSHSCGVKGSGYGVVSLARLQPDGTPDVSFDGDGFVYLDSKTGCTTPTSYSFTASPVVQPDSRIVAGGYGTLARFLPDGSVDSSFGGGDGIAKPTTPVDVDAIGVLPDGRIATGGENFTGLYAERFLPDGSPDPAFGGDGVARALIGHNMAGGGSAFFLDNEKIVIAGTSFPCSGGAPRQDACSSNLGLVRFTAAGEIDPTFGSGDGIVVADTRGRLEGGDLALAGQRLIVEGGALDRAFPTSALFALDPDGVVDTSFGDGGEVLPPRLPRCGGPPATHGSIYRTGTPEGDRIVVYSPGPEEFVRVFGYGGDDIIDASRDARHLICAGDDNDVIIGGPGDQAVYGGRGNDRLFLRRGLDKGFGGPGADLLSGSFGPDQLFGGSGGDRLVGGIGNDLLIGGIGDDLLLGGDGADLLGGGRGDDHLHGGAGVDQVRP